MVSFRDSLEVAIQIRSSRPELLYKKDALKNFANLQKKNLCRSLFFSKVVGLRPASLLKKRLRHKFFLASFAKIFKTIIL